MKKIITVYCSLLLLIGCSSDKKQTLAPEQPKEAVVHSTIVDTELVLDTIIPAAGIKYAEARKTDPSHPLVTIDLTATYDVKEVDLADFYSSVTYIKLRHPLSGQGYDFIDTARPRRTMYSKSPLRSFRSSTVYFAGNKIVAGDNMFGYYCYSMEGEYLYTVCAPNPMPEYEVNGNDVSITFDPEADQVVSFSVYGDNCLTQIDEAGGRKLLFHNLSSGKTYLSRPYYGEGDLCLLGPETYVDYQYNLFDTERFPYMFIFSSMGDTLCSFRNYNPLLTKDRNINYRTPENMDTYYYNNALTIRQTYSDTIFRFASPHELVPAFRLDHKDRKRNMDELLYNDKPGTFRILSISETDAFLLVLFSETNDKKGEGNKPHRLYHDKKEGRTYRLGYANGVGNSLEDAIPSSLGFMMQGSNNELYRSYTKTELSYLVNDQNYFDKLSVLQQSRLKALYEDLQDGEILVMILK